MIKKRVRYLHYTYTQKKQQLSVKFNRKMKKRKQMNDRKNAWRSSRNLKNALGPTVHPTRRPTDLSSLAKPVDACVAASMFTILSVRFHSTSRFFTPLPTTSTPTSLRPLKNFLKQQTNIPHSIQQTDTHGHPGKSSYFSLTEDACGLQMQRLSAVPSTTRRTS